MEGQNKQNSYTRQILDLSQTHIDSLFKQAVSPIAAAEEQINKVVEILCDDFSRNTFIQEIACLACNRLSHGLGEDFNPMPLKRLETLINIAMKKFNEEGMPVKLKFNPSEKESVIYGLYNAFYNDGYCYKDVVTIEPGEVFLDCGAYIGDTTLWAYHKGAEQVYSFEPSNEMVQNLKENLELNGRSTDRVFPYALSNQNTQDKFCVCTAAFVGSSLYRSSELQERRMENDVAHLQDVTCVRLDDWCKEHNVKPTFIKMDVEGAELDALEGCAETIKTLKPKLAICSYHKLEHEWEVPLYIHELVPEYKLYCRKSHFAGDMVIYAKI